MIIHGASESNIDMQLNVPHSGWREKTSTGVAKVKMYLHSLFVASVHNLLPHASSYRLSSLKQE